MGRDWIQYQCSSGQTLFLYNKITGEHKWPHGLGKGIEYRIMHGSPVDYKEYRTAATQTDDNGCNNGCMSMYINTDPRRCNTSENILPLQQSSVLNEVSFLQNAPCQKKIIKCEYRDEQGGSESSGMVRSDQSNLVENSNDNENNSSNYNDNISTDAVVRAHNENLRISEMSKNLDGMQCSSAQYSASGNVNDERGDGNSRTENDCKGDYIKCVYYYDENTGVWRSTVSHDDHVASEDFEDKSDSDVDDDDDENIGGDYDVCDNGGGGGDGVDDDINKVGSCKNIRKGVENQKKCKDVDGLGKNESVSYESERTDKSSGTNIGMAKRQRSKKSQSQQLSKCSVCNKKFQSKSYLDRHMIVHSREKNFECSYCKKKFAYDSSLKMHLRTHTGKNLLECSFCKKKFTKNSALVTHIRKHTNEKPFECSYCQKRFSRKGNLQTHLSIHTNYKPFECSVCEKRFIHNCNLIAHVKTIHNSDQVFECSICHETFSQEGQLQKHAKFHTEDRPFECSFCKKSFISKSHLNAHVKVHSENQPFECSVCNKTFYRKYHLDRHLKVHSGERA